ncbi:MAG TPA: hypothetical protein VFQ23_13425, partial [Anaerolineales bacterium]|nr:hypothetical protein [Anaerolineales bacterium]
MTKEQLDKKANQLGYLLVAIPLIIYWIYWQLNTSYWFNADPAAVYFLDSLSVFVGRSYTYVDHPGTPIQLIGTLFLALTYPFLGRQEAFIDFHLARPGAFFLMTNLFLLGMNIVTGFVFYKTVITTLNVDRLLGGVSIALAYFALHPYSFPSLTLWSHNSLNFPFGTLWLIWLFVELRKEQEIPRFKLILLGVAAGILLMAQMYFAAWLVSGIFTIFIFSFRLDRSISKAITSGSYLLAGGIIGIIAMLIPIYKELPRFFSWLTRIITHQGLYGSGEAGIYSLAFIPIAINFWWANIRPMILVLLATLIVVTLIAYAKNKSTEKVSPSMFAMVSGLVFQILLILLLMTKAALKLRYSLSLAAILPLLILLTVKLLETMPWRTILFRRVFYVLLLTGVGFNLVNQVVEQRQRAFVEADAALAKSQAVTHLAREKNVLEDDIV